MDNLDELKKEKLKKLKKLNYENKKAKQENENQKLKDTILKNNLIISKTETAKLAAESSHYQKIISGQKKKILAEGLVETDQEMELPQSLKKENQNEKMEMPQNLKNRSGEKTEKINVTGERKTPKI